MAQSKSTKKFEKHHLKDVLKKRKEGAKIKQRHQQAAKRKERCAKDNEKDEAVLAEQEKAGKKQKSGKEALNDMSVDDFFAGGFEIPKAVGAKGGLSRSGKRKRSDEKEKEDDASSVASVEDHALAAISGSEAGSGDEGDDMDTHKGDLKALAEKDPEFFKYLQENDAELLDFEDTNLDEIDELSGSEEEEEETKPKKGKKKAAKEEEDITAKGEISLVTVKKWSAAMKDQYSLRAMREVVLAFRAAAHLNEEDGKQYKYTISDSNGRFCETSNRLSDFADRNQCTTSFSFALSSRFPLYSSTIYQLKSMRMAKRMFAINVLLISTSDAFTVVSQPTPRNSEPFRSCSSLMLLQCNISWRHYLMPQRSRQRSHRFSLFCRTHCRSRSWYAIFHEL